MDYEKQRMQRRYRCNDCGHETGQPNRHVNNTGHGGYRLVWWTEPHNYRSAHRLVHELRGSPHSHKCQCGATAQGWALRAELHTFGKMSWSPNPDDYDALCQMCHKRQDWPKDTWRKNALKARSIAGARGGAALRNRRQEDPELNAKILKAMSDTGRQLTSDPVHQAKMQEGLRRKRETDPEFEKRFREAKSRAGKVTAERRRAAKAAAAEEST